MQTCSSDCSFLFERFHHFVTDTINGGADPRVVQTMVGHASVRTTMGYMHSNIERILAEYLHSHPRGCVRSRHLPCGLRSEQIIADDTYDRIMAVKRDGRPFGRRFPHRIPRTRQIALRADVQCRKALDIYLIERDKAAKRHGIETQALFFALRNRYASEKKRDVPERPQRWPNALHITKVRGLPPMHPHLLRHACATHMLDHGCPLDVIASILGHDNLDVTAHHAQVSTRLMMAEYSRAHPHAKQ